VFIVGSTVRAMALVTSVARTFDEQPGRAPAKVAPAAASGPGSTARPAPR
jgi:hypothetical protein